MSKKLQPDQIVSHCLLVLQEGGYQVQSEALRIVDLSFGFDQVLTGPHGRQALVLLVDQEELAVDALKRRLSSLTLALSRTGSRRPVTLILVSPRPTPQDIDALRQLARLVAIDRVAQTAISLDDNLREFRPLDITDVSAPLFEASDELKKALGSEASSPQARKLIRAASRGREAVEQTFQTLLAEAIKGPAAETP